MRRRILCADERRRRISSHMASFFFPSGNLKQHVFFVAFSSEQKLDTADDCRLINELSETSSGSHEIHIHN